MTYLGWHDPDKKKPAQAAARDELLNDIVAERPQTLYIVCGDPATRPGDLCVGCSDVVGNGASLAPLNELSNASKPLLFVKQTTGSQYVRERPHIEGVLVVLRRGASIALSPDAYELLGSPAYVTLLYSRSTRRIGIRATDDPTAQRVTGKGPMRARMEVLEQRDAARDARDAELYLFDVDGRWVGRREAEAA